MEGFALWFTPERAGRLYAFMSHYGEAMEKRLADMGREEFGLEEIAEWARMRDEIRHLQAMLFYRLNRTA